MTMADLPTVLLTTKDGGDPKRNRGHLLSSTDLRLEALDLEDVGELRTFMIRYPIKSHSFAFSVMRRGKLRGLTDLVPATGGRAEWIRKRYIRPMREQLKNRTGISLHERI